MLLNPRVDFAFKKLFGAEGHQDILIAFINAVLMLKEPITHIELLNPFNHKNSPADKLSIMDIKARDTAGRYYNIEMQVTDEVYYNQRALYYWSKLYTSQLKEGSTFGTLNKTISINILNFRCFDDEAHYHNVFRILNIRSYQCCFEDLELHFIELPKFDKDLAHLQTALDRWTTFLQKAERYTSRDLPAELKQEPAIDKAMQALETLYLTDEERMVYDSHLAWLRDEAAAVEKAELKGHERGKAEATKQIARQMLKQGLPVSTISTTTGLNQAALEALDDSE